ncbi:MAG: NTP transferase domain-containing protein [Firmicutes bacterium]|nr:NTP transferase domain-containing protein [Bacillota bacterium]
MQISALVLAGGIVEESLREKFNVSSKAFIPLNGRMMVEYVLDTLSSISSVDKIAIAIPGGELPDELSGKINFVAPSGKNIIESLKNGISSFDPVPEKILVVTCDSPLVSRESIEDFISKCDDASALCYSYVEKNTSVAKFPEVRHTYVKLKEGFFCGGSLILVSPSILNDTANLLERVTEMRKKPWQVAGLLGFKTITGLLFGTLSVPRLEAKATELLGEKVQGILSPYPESAVNVDDINELEVIERKYML